MSEQEQLRTILIEIFPELRIKDFPEINPKDSSSTWLMDWKTNYECSEKIIASCEFSNFSWLLEQNFKKLTIVKSSGYNVSNILKDIFSYIEQFKDHTDHALIDLNELEYDASFFDDDELSFEEQYAIAIDNITSDILQHDLSVLVIEHGENIDFILSQATFETLSKLEKILKMIYDNSDVTLYYHTHQQDYSFESLLKNQT
ncbi:MULTISPECIES: hypothetical protein [Acinetobacter]|uniref:Uncharacterized protein n=1 Tax=Acinetobacter piscicola TaxID=2006115 RepID=A0A7S6VXI6_9GAMM|nr:MULTISPECIES: hypothetical protein [Acinetobacter]MDM1757270.1 hypothetical protein [Acinetobacter sp. 256-1]MDM1760262.1 hypothetical protein [Acinetobacter sp. 251-1]QOW46720.1 hypothetical protein G0028_12890 [Acinetobacter piscicola]